MTAGVIEFDEDVCKDLRTAKKKEWLITNGIGGYSSSTVAGVHTRRYHGLLVAAARPPLGRLVLLSQLEDVLIVDGQRFDLSTHLYVGNVVHPSGHMNLNSFSLDAFPIYTYSCDDWQLSKSILMVYGENTTVVEYCFNSRALHHSISLQIRPLIAFRDYHATTHENSSLNRAVVQTVCGVEVQPYDGLPSLYLAHDPALVEVAGHWYRDFDYEEEQARGLDHTEDLFSPLLFKADLTQEHRFSLIASTEPRSVANVSTYKHAEFRRSALSHYRYRSQLGASSLIPALYRAADQFICARPPYRTIVAGYHWFADWGRDAMIALPGLLLETDRPDIAKELLLQYVTHIDGGMLPNRFPESGEEPEYNTVDATLWFFEAIRRYLTYRNDPDWRESAERFVREQLYGSLKGIIEAHLAGTRFGIHVDDNGFLWAGDSKTQLTWMDARVGDYAITPRSGRPVEIQALWYNALCTMEWFARRWDEESTADGYAALAQRLKANFEAVFWNAEGEYLYDVVEDSIKDASMRPNQILAVGLHYSLVSQARARKVLAAVQRELLTPFGLRTLSPRDERYRGCYEGNVWSRDSAYHQGTVWPWLAGPFFSALLQTSDDPQAKIKEIETWLGHLEQHLQDAGLGQISEIFDGDYPHLPRGCIAQAWSVAEILRLAKMVARHPARRVS